jgi:hypothetical protein
LQSSTDPEDQQPAQALTTGRSDFVDMAIRFATANPKLSPAQIFRKAMQEFEDEQSTMAPE